MTALRGQRARREARSGGRTDSRVRGCAARQGGVRAVALAGAEARPPPDDAVNRGGLKPPYDHALSVTRSQCCPATNSCADPRARASPGHGAGAAPAAAGPRARTAPTLRRHLKSLVASGDLIKIRGNRFGLADRMDVVVGRLQTHARGLRVRRPRTPAPTSRISTSRRRTSRKRCTATASSRASSTSTARSHRGRIIRILERGEQPARRPLRVGRLRPRLRRAVRPRLLAGRAGAGWQTREGRTPGATWWSSSSRAGRPRRARRSAASSRCSAPIDEPGVDTQIIIRKHNIPDAHGDEARRRGAAPRRRRPRAGPPRPHRLPAAARPSRSTASTPATSTMRSRSSGCRTATTGWASTSPTCRTTWRRAARSTRKPTSAARRCTSRSARCTCSRRRSRRASARSTRTSIGSCSPA